MIYTIEYTILLGYRKEKQVERFHQAQPLVISHKTIANHNMKQCNRLSYYKDLC